jgi:hypothetical protein
MKKGKVMLKAGRVSRGEGKEIAEDAEEVRGKKRE